MKLTSMDIRRNYASGKLSGTLTFSSNGPHYLSTSIALNEKEIDKLEPVVNALIASYVDYAIEMIKEEKAKMLAIEHRGIDNA